MKEKDLLIQLKKLKGVRPDADWKQRNRELLYTQISAQADDSVKIGWFKSLEQHLSIAFLRVSQPAMTVLVIIIFIFGGSVLSLRAARNTAPGDSMYIAKILSEKTQYALTFNEKSKAKLGLEFAGNRVKEINKVLAQTEDSNRAETVEKLKDDFKKEISGVKDRLAKIEEQKNTSKESAPIKSEENEENNEDGTEVAVNTNNSGEPEESFVFSAAFDRDDKGVQIAEGTSKEESEADKSAEKTEDLSAEAAPTTTPESAEAATSSADTAVGGENAGGPEAALLEAGELLNQDNYSATLNKLDEAGEAMDSVSPAPSTSSGQVESGEVLGVEEAATASSTGG